MSHFIQALRMFDRTCVFVIRLNSDTGRSGTFMMLLHCCCLSELLLPYPPVHYMRSTGGIALALTHLNRLSYTLSERDDGPSGRDFQACVRFVQVNAYGRHRATGNVVHAVLV